MAGSLGLAWLGLGVAAQQPGLAATAALTYYTCGLLYEYTHYIVHTRVVPRTKVCGWALVHGWMAGWVRGWVGGWAFIRVWMGGWRQG